MAHNLLDGKIFLAEQRGMHQDQFIRRYSCFNFNTYFNVYKQPFGKLFLWNDECIIGGHSTSLIADRSCYLITIPITGAIELITGADSKVALDVGEVQVTYLHEGAALDLVNPYEKELVNYLQVGIACTTAEADCKALNQGHFDLAQQNEMHPVIFRTAEAFPFHLSIGRFSGRGEGLCKLNGDHSSLFCFVIAGAFELEGRLMHERDGLALWNITSAECEALSNQAVLLAIELN